MFDHFWAIWAFLRYSSWEGHFYPKRVILTPCQGLEQPKITQRGGYGLKTLPITIYAWAPTNIKHLDPFWGNFSIKIGAMPSTMGLWWLFRGQNAHLMKRTWGRPKWPKSVQICILTLFLIQGGYLVTIWSSGAAWRGLCYFLLVAIFQPKNRHFQTPAAPDR